MDEPKKQKEPVQKPRQSGGQMLIIALLGAGLGILGTLYAQDLIEVITPVALTVLLTLFAVAVLLYLGITLYRDRIIRYLFGEDIHFDSALSDAQDMVKQTIIGTTEAIPGLDPSKKKQLQQAAPRMANYLIWSRFRSQGLRMMVGFMVAIGGLATTILLFNQNRLLEKQNEKIDMQMSLEESNRRSAMMNQMANLLDKIDEELRDTFNTNHGTRVLSPQLIGRISSLSQALKPYRYLVGNTLSKELSPERGQLLLALINSSLDKITLEKIWDQVTFKYADLSRVFLKDVHLEGLDLKGSSFSRATLENITITKSNLEEADFARANLKNVNFSFSNLRQANLSRITQPFSLRSEHLHRDKLKTSRSSYFRIDLSDTSLDRAVLSDANLEFTNFQAANLSHASLRSTNLNGSDLSFAILKYADLTGAELISADLGRTELFSANLTNANLNNAAFNGSYLERAVLVGVKNITTEGIGTSGSLYMTTGLTAKLKTDLNKCCQALFSSPENDVMLRIRLNRITREVQNAVESTN